MKKLLLAVVLPLAATSVYAETSVMLYGGADGGITVQKQKENLQRLGLPTAAWIPICSALPERKISAAETMFS